MRINKKQLFSYLDFWTFKSKSELKSEINQLICASVWATYYTEWKQTTKLCREYIKTRNLSLNNKMKIHHLPFVISDSEWAYLLVTPLDTVWEEFFIEEYHKLQNDDKYNTEDYSNFYFELSKRTRTIIEYLGNDRFIDLNVC